MTRTDLPLIAAWLAEPHVARWMGDRETALGKIGEHLGDDAVEPYIVLMDGSPIGYIQAYAPHREAGHPYRDQPPGTIGIDQFIGRAELIGRGHGPRLVDAFVRRLFAAGAPRVVLDPDVANAAAIRAYAKAGFVPIGERTSIYGHTLMMARDAEGQIT